MNILVAALLVVVFFITARLVKHTIDNDPDPDGDGYDEPPL